MEAVVTAGVLLDGLEPGVLETMTGSVFGAIRGRFRYLGLPPARECT